MKTLTLLRHAKSSWDDAAARDFDRPLNGRGRRAAQTIGREMRALGLTFDQVIASPAVRVVETLREVEQGYGGRWGASSTGGSTWLRQSCADWSMRLATAGSALLLWTQSGPGDTLPELGGAAPGRDRDNIRLPLTEISFPVERWADVGRGATAPSPASSARAAPRLGTGPDEVS
jgi:phosphohistidine phosphatase